MEYEYRISSSTHWRMNGKIKTIVTNLFPLKQPYINKRTHSHTHTHTLTHTHTYSHTHTCQTNHVNITNDLKSL
jgi:hypothetical protein